MASSTRSRVAGRTRSGRFSTLETVPTDTPARFATSVTDGRRDALVTRAHSLPVGSRQADPLGAELLDVGDAEQRHGTADLSLEDLHRALDAALSAGHEPVQVGPADQGRVCAQRERG